MCVFFSRIQKMTLQLFAGRRPAPDSVHFHSLSPSLSDERLEYQEEEKKVKRQIRFEWGEEREDEQDGALSDRKDKEND